MARSQTAGLDKGCPAVLGPGPRALYSVCEAGGGPKRSCPGLVGQPALGKENLGLGRTLLARKDSRPVRQGLWDPVCGT